MDCLLKRSCHHNVHLIAGPMPGRKSKQYGEVPELSTMLAGTESMPQRHMTRHALHAVNLAGHLHLGSQTTEATARHALTADMTLITMNPAALTLDRLIACLQRMKAWMKGNCVPSAGLMLVCKTSVKLKLHSHDSWQPALQCVYNIVLCTLISWMYLSV
jgi:hypothetical protein